MRQVLQVYVVDGKLLRVVICFYRKSKACVAVSREVSEYFPVKSYQRQGCVMSPWLVNIMDGLVREVKARVMEEWASMV